MHFTSIFEGTYKMQIPFLLFLLAFIAADIIFYKFLQLKSILTEKYFYHFFFCWQIHQNTSYTAKKTQWNHDKSFLSLLPNQINSTWWKNCWKYKFGNSHEQVTNKTYSNHILFAQIKIKYKGDNFLRYNNFLMVCMLT